MQKQQSCFAGLINFAGSVFFIASFFAFMGAIFVLFGFGTFFHMSPLLSFAFFTGAMILAYQTFRTGNWSYAKSAGAIMFVGVMAGIMLSFLAPLISGMSPIVDGNLNGVRLSSQGSGPINKAVSSIDLGSMMGFYQYALTGVIVMFAIVSLLPENKSQAEQSAAGK